MNFFFKCLYYCGLCGTEPVLRLLWIFYLNSTLFSSIILKPAYYNFTFSKVFSIFWLSWHLIMLENRFRRKLYSQFADEGYETQRLSCENLIPPKWPFPRCWPNLSMGFFSNGSSSFTIYSRIYSHDHKPYYWTFSGRFFYCKIVYCSWHWWIVFLLSQ